MSIIRNTVTRKRVFLLALLVAALLALAAGVTSQIWAASSASTRVAPATQKAANEDQTTPTATPQAGATGKPWLGVIVNDADGGARVVQVLPSSPAAKAELKRDDIVSAVNGAAVANAQGFVDEVHKFKPGDKLTLTVKRDGQEKQIEVIAGTLKQQTNIAPRLLGPRQLPPELKGLEGILPRDMFSHFVGGMFKLKDKDGNLVTVNLIPGKVVTATATSLTISPNDPLSSGTFDVSNSTVVEAARPNAKVEDLKADDTVLVVTVGDSNHASMVIKVAPAYNPLGDLVPHFNVPRVWQMPGPRGFDGWHNFFKRPAPKPNA